MGMTIEAECYQSCECLDHIIRFGPDFFPETSNTRWIKIDSKIGLFRDCSMNRFENIGNFKNILVFFIKRNRAPEEGLYRCQEFIKMGAGLLGL
mmetsp:Transcript_116824/g.337535  ORF Transcript_116824/g.337535 Transcript_116824/m.337535 type:complete len:94 (-) Transcript_116824:282-563(-)